MEYRRFGKSNKKVSTITLGGMRFTKGWDNPRHEIPKETQTQCNELVRLALDSGINLIESAYGYVKSETVFGRTLNQELNIPRNSYYLMTKGTAKTAEEIRTTVEQQLKDLQTDYIDFYGFHGINKMKILNSVMQEGGVIDELLKMKNEGIIKHLGFSTHAPLDVILKAIGTDTFDFVNLHYYYFFQRNYAAIALAEHKDMGVFIISPNDKGGQLFNAPEKVKAVFNESTSPIQWNARFCLKSPAVHTLSFGMTEAAHFEEMKGIFPVHVPFSKQDYKIKLALDAMVLDDPYAQYEGYDLQHDPSEIDIPGLLRLRKLWKCYGMLNFGRYRYKELKTPNHWFPGVVATEENLANIDYSKVPLNIPLKEMLAEVHEAFYIPEKPKAPDFTSVRVAKE